VNRAHFKAVQPLLDAVLSGGHSGEFFHLAGGDPRPRPYRGRYAVVDAGLVLEVLRRFQWHKNFSFEPILDFLRRAQGTRTLRDWAVIVPELAATSPQVVSRTVDGYRLDIVKRERRTTRDGMFSGSSPRQRLALEIVSGGALQSGHKSSLDIDRHLKEPRYQH